MSEKPMVRLIGTDGNVFSLLGQCKRALTQAGQPEKAKELSSRIFDCPSYDAALALMAEYVDVE